MNRETYNLSLTKDELGDLQAYAESMANAAGTPDGEFDWAAVAKQLADAKPDEADSAPPPCPKCGSGNTSDTGFEEIGGEVAIVECQSCRHEFHVAIQTMYYEITDDRLSEDEA